MQHRYLGKILLGGVVAGLVILNLYLVLVWPTFYRYEEDIDLKDVGRCPLRVNRFTGTREVYREDDGWYRLGPGDRLWP